MKIAVIGNSLEAYLSALHFFEVGADVRLFTTSKFSQIVKKLPDDFKLPQVKYEFFKSLNEISSVEKFLEVAHGELLQNNLLKNADVLRVHKKCLKPFELPQNGQSRLADLFRVVYRLNVSNDFIESQKENSEILEKLGKDVIESLKNSIESYEDFDVIINASGFYSASFPMGASHSHALNEKEVSKDQAIFYGFNWPLDFCNQIKNANKVTLVGDGLSNFRLLKNIANHFTNIKNLEVNIISSSQVPFSEVISELTNTNSEGIENLNNLINLNQDEFDSDIEKFNNEILAWKDLADYERVKVPKPAEPKSRLTIYNGAVVSSVDKLLDREGIFLTIEGNELLGTREIVKTLSTDLIFVSNGENFVDDFEKYLSISEEEYSKRQVSFTKEPGFYRLKQKNVEDNIKNIMLIEEELMKFFSRASE